MLVIFLMDFPTSPKTVGCKNDTLGPSNGWVMWLFKDDDDGWDFLDELLNVA